MKNRIGLGKDKGMGYKNMTQIDPNIHSLSAKGIKTKTNLQPIKINPEQNRLSKLVMKYDITTSDLKEIEEKNDSKVESVEDWYDEKDFILITLEDGTTYVIAPSDDKAEELALERVKEDLENEPQLFSPDWLVNQIDKDKAKDFFENVYDEWNRSYVDDIEDESDNEYPNRLRQEMVERDLITEKEAKDENFDIENKKDDFVDEMTKDQLDEGLGGYSHYKGSFGKEEADKLVLDNNLIDIDDASQDAIDTDGWQHFLSRYDGDSTDLNSGKVMWKED